MPRTLLALAFGVLSLGCEGAAQEVAPTADLGGSSGQADTTGASGKRDDAEADTSTSGAPTTTAPGPTGSTTDACAPRSCADVEMACGLLDDGCGGTIDCTSPCPDATQCVEGVCDPGAGPWLDLLDHRLGFARDVVGGAGGPLFHVTSLADDGPGTLREAAQIEGPLWIVFDLSGDLVLDSPLDLSSFKTLDGRGQDVTIRGEALRILEVQDVIVHGLSFDEHLDDGITVSRGASPVWIDHCTFGVGDDGAVDFTRADPDQPMLVTVSWCRFEGHDKTMLVGLQDEHAPDDENLQVTVARSVFSSCVQRMPRVAQGWTHALNVVYEDWGSYVFGATQDARVLVDGSWFLAGDQSTLVRTDMDPFPSGDPWPGNVSMRDSVFSGTSEVQIDPQDVPVPDYPFEVWPSTEANRALVDEAAGAHSSPTWPEPA